MSNYSYKDIPLNKIISSNFGDTPLNDYYTSISNLQSNDLNTELALCKVNPTGYTIPNGDIANQSVAFYYDFSNNVVIQNISDLTPYSGANVLPNSVQVLCIGGGGGRGGNSGGCNVQVTSYGDQNATGGNGQYGSFSQINNTDNTTYPISLPWTIVVGTAGEQGGDYNNDNNSNNY
jgi:hypothetical protein